MAIHDPTNTKMNLTATQAMEWLEKTTNGKMAVIVVDDHDLLCPKCGKKVYSYQKKQKYHNKTYHKNCLEEKLRINNHFHKTQRRKGNWRAMSGGMK